MSRAKLVIAVAIAIVMILCISIFCFFPIPVKDPFSNHTGDGFSIIQITDTQFLSESYPQLYNNLTRWIVANSAATNLLMVIHTGDVVDIANSTQQWTNANNAMMFLYNNSVPYCWDAGNHDLINDLTGKAPNSYQYLGKNYPAFNPAIMSAKPYWVNSSYDGTSTAVKFSYKNYKFMVINVQYDGNSSVLAWMENLITANPTVNIIVATHNYLNGCANYGFWNNPIDIAWAKSFEAVLNKYPNVFMTLNGHDIGESPSAQKSVQIGKTGISREEIFFNMQGQYSKQGAAIARIYTFNVGNPSKPTITAYEYATAGLPVYVHGFVKILHLQGDVELYNAAPQYLAEKFSFSPHLIAS